MTISTSRTLPALICLLFLFLGTLVLTPTPATAATPAGYFALTFTVTPTSKDFYMPVLAFPGASTQNSAGFSLLKNDTEVLDQNNATGIILGTAPLSGDRVSYKVSKGDTEEFTLFVLHSNDTLPKGTIAPDRVRFDAENADISVDDGSLSIKFDLVEKE